MLSDTVARFVSAQVDKLEFFEQNYTFNKL